MTPFFLFPTRFLGPHSFVNTHLFLLAMRAVTALIFAVALAPAAALLRQESASGVLVTGDTNIIHTKIRLNFFCDASFCLPTTRWFKTKHYCTAIPVMRDVECLRGEVVKNSIPAVSTDTTYVTYKEFCSNSNLVSGGVMERWCAASAFLAKQLTLLALFWPSFFLLFVMGARFRCRRMSQTTKKKRSALFCGW